MIDFTKIDWPVLKRDNVYCDLCGEHLMIEETIDYSDRDGHTLVRSTIPKITGPAKDPFCYHQMMWTPKRYEVIE